MEGSRARAAPQRGLRPPARCAQSCESGGKARSASGGRYPILQPAPLSASALAATPITLFSLFSTRRR